MIAELCISADLQNLHLGGSLRSVQQLLMLSHHQQLIGYRVRQNQHSLYTFVPTFSRRLDLDVSQITSMTSMKIMATHTF